MGRILVVDDDRAVLTTLRLLLSKEGHEVLMAADGQAALQLAREEAPDLIILDVMLPRLDGLEVCRILRQESPVPILMLTGRGDEVDKVLGLELGADDYLTKPFSQRELLARVKALLRRARMIPRKGDEPSTDRLPGGPLQLDLASDRATLNGKPLFLKPKEFDLLAYLMSHRGQAFSAEQLLREVWGHQDTSDPRTVVVHIRWLREKLEVDPSRPQLIETVKGVGYRFRAPENRDRQ